MDDDIVFNDLHDDECNLISSLYDEAERRFFGAQYLQDGTLDYVEFYFDGGIIRVKSTIDFIKLLKLKAFW
jgi:hypothetical protein